MSTIVTRTGKGSALSWAEADANFTNLNTDKVETSALGDSALLDVGTAAGTVAAGDHNHSGVYEPADATILKDADIGSTVLGYVAPSTSGNVLTSNGSAWTSTAPATGGAFKNKIIGGDFTLNPWQRGTSFAAATNGAFSADRFQWNASSDAVVTIAKTADAPTVAQAGIYTQHCLHVDITTADATIAAGQYAYIHHRIEGYNTASFGFGQSGTRSITLSFWVKSTVTGTYCVTLLNSATDRRYTAEYTVNVTNTWEKKTVTITVDTTGTWLYDNGVGLTVAWMLAAGSTNNTMTNATWTTTGLSTSGQVNALSSTSNDFKLALVQLEAGATATEFEVVSAQQVLAQCQRYYYRVAGGANTSYGSAYGVDGTRTYGNLPFPVKMRAAPSALEQSGTATDYGFHTGTTATTCSAVPQYQSFGTAEAAGILFTYAAGIAASQGGAMRFLTANAYLGWSAEL